MNIRYLFLGVLFVNGAGSSILAVGYPYGLLAGEASMSRYYLTMGVVFLFISLGTLFWGRHIDRSENIWQMRMRILALELACSLALLLLVLSGWDLSALQLLCLIAVLEFLFAYEIPWSRVAWHELNSWSHARGAPKIDHAFAIVATTSLISAIGPGVGAFLGMEHGLAVLAAIKTASLVPYSVVCWRLMRVQMPRVQSAGGATRPRNASLSAVFDLPSYRVLAATIATTLVASAFLMVALPVEVNRSLLGMNPIWVIAFYLLSAVIPIWVAHALGRMGHRGPVSAQPASTLLGLLVLGCLFFTADSFYAKCLAYVLYNVAIVFFNMMVTDVIYQKGLERHQGRLFALVQVVSGFAYPVAAAIAAAPLSWQGQLPLVSFVAMSLMALTLCWLFQINKVVAAARG
ncbi:Uncharacterised protein [Bordetella ansorpii]|uniref:Major Facilitator Superfamily n=1 Tax=Bordetella ansorpii TaxID=288768 RepID=A0A157QMA1_9BORD|nr:hypothetical protein [Bordetella ansorpii]SAI47033.1 Uncharacterised protein [Bordetella ansorpii]